MKMFPYRFMLTCVSLLGLACNSMAGQLTLENARAQTLANSPNVVEMEQRLMAAQAVLRQTRSAWYPQVAAEADYMSMSIDQQPDFNPTIRVEDSFLQSDAGVTVSWLLFDGFARNAHILAAKAGTQAAGQLVVNMRRLMLEAVTVAFYQAQLAQENMEIAQQDMSFNSLLEKDAERRWKSGSAPEAEKLTFQVRALQAESSFLQADNALQSSAIVLAELMGIPDTSLTDKQLPVRHQQMLHELALPNADDEIQYALSHRPDINALRAQQEALRQEVRANQSDWFPEIALTAGADYQHLDNLDPIQNNRSQFAGVVASWDLFAGGRNVAETAEAEANLHALEAQLVQKELEIRSEVQSSILAAKTAHAIGLRQEQAQQLSMRIRDFVEKAYRAGSATQTRLNEVQTDLIRTSGATVQARITYQLALARLEASTGRLDGSE